MESKIKKIETVEHCKYWAFISYSHQDMKWGSWLHKAIESYKIPKHLVGRQGRYGAIPKRVFPIFRDTTEFPAAGDLQQEMYDALQNSKNLLVICSPNAAKSTYVNEEVRYFKTIGRQDRILGLIVDGDPNASETPEKAEMECFPEAVRFSILPDGRIGETLVQPIAADIRAGKDKQKDGLLRIIAGIFDLSFDELKMRDRQRRFNRLSAAIALTVTILAVVGVLFTWQEIEKRNQIQEKLIQSYTAIGQKEIDASNLRRASVYLGEAYSLGGKSVRLQFLLAHAIEAFDIQRDSMFTGDSKIRKVKFSSDGQYLLTLSGRSQMDLWDMSNTKHLSSLVDGTGRIEDVVFSSDNRTILTCGLDRVVRIWETGSGKLLKRLRDHDSLHSAVSIDPRGRFFATLGIDGSAAIWDLEKQSFHVRLHQVNTLIRPPMVFDPSGRLLITYGGIGDRLLLWDVLTGALINNVTVRKDSDSILFINKGEEFITIAEDGKFEVRRGDNGIVKETITTASDELVYAGTAHERNNILFVGADGGVYVWNSQNRHQSLTFETSMKNPSVTAFDGRLIALKTFEKPAYQTVWDVKSGTKIGTIKVFGEDLGAAAIKPGSAVILTGSDEGNLTYWDLGGGRRNFQLPGHSNMVNVVVFNADGSKLITAGSEASVKIWDCQTRRIVSELNQHEAAVFQAGFNNDGSKIVTLSIDGAIGVWDSLTGAPERFIQELKAKDMVVSPGEDFTVAISIGSSAMLWYPGPEKSIALDKHNSEITSMRFSLDGSLLAIGSVDGTVGVWDTASGKSLGQLWGHRDSVTSIDFNHDMRQLLTTSKDATAIVWALKEKESLCTFDGHQDGINVGRFSSDGKICITGSNDHTTKMWNISNCKILNSLDLHTGPIKAVSFSRDDKMIITAGEDKAVNIWETRSGELILSLPVHKEEVLDIAVSPDADLLATAAKESIARIWDLALEDRPREQISELIEKYSKLQLYKGRLVAEESGQDAEGVMQERTMVNTANRKLQTSSEFDSSTIPSVIAKFINALQNGIVDDVKQSVGQNASFALKDLSAYAKSDLKSFSDLFEGGEIQNTRFRMDRMAALVLLSTAEGRLDILVEEEDGEWRIIDIRGRPSATHQNYKP